MNRSEEFKILYMGLGLVILLNIFDMISTLYWCIVSGHATEANPLIYQLMLINPGLAIGFKILMILMFTSLMLLAARMDIRLACRGTFIVAIIYLLLAGWHMVGPSVTAILAFAVIF